MISVLSSGFGRLHLAQSADWLSKAGVSVRLVCGWVPLNPDGWLVRLCSRLVGRDLSAGMRKRRVVLQNGGEVLPCGWAEFLCQGLCLLNRILFRGRCQDAVLTFSWKIFGWQSRKYLKQVGSKNAIFHVRSGAGHGGAIDLAHQLGIPVVVDHSIAHPAFMEEHLRHEFERNGAMFDLGLNSSFWHMIIEDCEKADVLLVNSYFVRDTFIAQGYSADRIRVVYLGTRPDFFGLRTVKACNRGDRKLKLLFTGGFGFRKGAEYILESIKLLKGLTSIPFEMDVVGDYCGAKGLLNSYVCDDLPITFHGPVPQDDLKRFLATSDIYVFPSLAEGCACSGMEAMSAGLCVVATHESGFPIENDKNGCIVPGKDAKAIAIRVLWLMEHPEEIDSMGSAAAELIRSRYTWEQYAEKVRQIYDELNASRTTSNA